LVHDAELEFLASSTARVIRRVLRQPLPTWFAPEPFTLDDGPFGAFPRSHALSDDGRIVVVDTCGHTPGHVSVICVDDSGRHIMLAGDATDSLEQLYALRADAVAPDPNAHIATMQTISLTAPRTPRSICHPTIPTQRHGSRTTSAETPLAAA
jgi:glyoxylase-like metal-dependent hydrolase (beta-lactamase superfamily II)